MQVDEILYELTHFGRLPKKALRAATAQRSELLPRFLAEIETYVDGDEAQRLAPTPLFLVFHLLGEWRESSAYRPLARLLRCLPDDVDEVLGESITITSHRVMAAVFDGDPQPLYGIIRDPKAEEYLRSRMCEALAMLVHEGRLQRAEAAGFLGDCFDSLLPQAECFVWQGWQSAIALLGLEELKEMVKTAFDRGFIDPQWLSYGHFEQDLAWSIAHPGELRRPDRKEYTLFGEVIEELSTWYGFSDAYLHDRERKRQRLPDPVDSDSLFPEPVINPFRDVGRNDPCPCGSGKKFKRCCLQ